MNTKQRWLVSGYGHDRKPDIAFVELSWPRALSRELRLFGAGYTRVDIEKIEQEPIVRGVMA